MQAIYMRGCDLNFYIFRLFLISLEKDGVRFTCFDKESGAIHYSLPESMEDVILGELRGAPSLIAVAFAVMLTFQDYYFIDVINQNLGHKYSVVIYLFTFAALVLDFAPYVSKKFDIDRVDRMVFLNTDGSIDTEKSVTSRYSSNRFAEIFEEFRLSTLELYDESGF